ACGEAGRGRTSNSSKHLPARGEAGRGRTSNSSKHLPACGEAGRGRGIDFRHERARELFQQAGMKVEDNRVRFDAGFVLEMAGKAPEIFDLQARNPKHTVTLGGDNMVTAPVYGPPFITDLERGRRGAVIEDFNNFDKMSQAVEQIHCAGGTTVEPEDLPLSSRHLDMVYSHIRWSDKPFMGSVISSENARDTIEMA